MEQKLKKKKHEKKLVVTRVDFKPMPLSDLEIKEMAKRLEEMAKNEADFAAVAGLKNELEASIYGWGINKGGALLHMVRQDRG